jgi:hypothetical protein
VAVLLPRYLPWPLPRSRGVTVLSLPSPRYYREIFPVPAVITAVTAGLPSSPLPCHSLFSTFRTLLRMLSQVLLLRLPILVAQTFSTTRMFWFCWKSWKNLVSGHSSSKYAVGCCIGVEKCELPESSNNTILASEDYLEPTWFLRFQIIRFITEMCFLTLI